jgi:hypothetical protein
MWRAIALLVMKQVVCLGDGDRLSVRALLPVVFSF